jgi:hypothetical protein
VSTFNAARVWLSDEPNTNAFTYVLNFGIFENEIAVLVGGLFVVIDALI